MWQTVDLLAKQHAVHTRHDPVSCVSGQFLGKHENKQNGPAQFTKHRGSTRHVRVVGSIALRSPFEAPNSGLQVP